MRFLTEEDSGVLDDQGHTVSWSEAMASTATTAMRAFAFGLRVLGGPLCAVDGMV